jgi:hypothetical protein
VEILLNMWCKMKISSKIEPASHERGWSLFKNEIFVKRAFQECEGWHDVILHEGMDVKAYSYKEDM